MVFGGVEFSLRGLGIRALGFSGYLRLFNMQTIRSKSGFPVAGAIYGGSRFM